MSEKEIRPIETIYKGYRFRSRLEARWAVFFDKLGVQYEYEPEGFEMDDGTKYLPDFYLPVHNAYIEIKGIGALKGHKAGKRWMLLTDGREQAEKYNKFIDCASKDHLVALFEGDPYDALIARETINSLNFSAVCTTKLLKEKSIISNNIVCQFNNDCSECPIYSALDRIGELAIGFTPEMVLYDAGEIFMLPADMNHIGVVLGTDEVYQGYTIQTNDFIQDVMKSNEYAAYAARQARFEHGEHG